MSLLGALVSAGASLIGGASKRSAQRKANEANRPVNQVREWEEAGINPIMGITQGQWIPHQAVSMGDAFSAAGGHIARGLELQHQEDLEETELKKENDELRKQLDDVAMRGEPSYMSQYGGLVPLPVEGGGNENFSGFHQGLSSLLPDTDSLRSRGGGLAGTRSGPAKLNDNEAPLFTAFGVDFVGSGNFSNGQTIEDSIGELGGLVAAPLILGDAVVNTAARGTIDRINSRREADMWGRISETLSGAMPKNPKHGDEWRDSQGRLFRFRRSRYGVGWEAVAQ